MRVGSWGRWRRSFSAWWWTAYGCAGAPTPGDAGDLRAPADRGALRHLDAALRLLRAPHGGRRPLRTGRVPWRSSPPARHLRSPTATTSTSGLEAAGRAEVGAGRGQGDRHRAGADRGAAFVEALLSGGMHQEAGRGGVLVQAARDPAGAILAEPYPRPALLSLVPGPLGLDVGSNRAVHGGGSRWVTAWWTYGRQRTFRARADAVGGVLVAVCGPISARPAPASRRGRCAPR